MTTTEHPIVFDCQGCRLIGIVHRPENPRRRGLLILVGGPQYRIGSHRQYLFLARELADAGIPVMRFDYRGIGDSEGTYPGFEAVMPDVKAAIEAFFRSVPELREVALWGLCEGAATALFTALGQTRIWGLALVNPWVRTEAGLAKVHLKHYYARRLLAADFWRKLVFGELQPLRAIGSFLADVTTAWRGTKTPGHRQPSTDAGRPLPDRMADAMEAFPGTVLVLLSGDDLTAQEFSDMAGASPRWRRLLNDPRVTRYEIAGADHTFSTRAWHQRMLAATRDWLLS